MARASGKRLLIIVLTLVVAVLISLDLTMDLRAPYEVAAKPFLALYRAVSPAVLNSDCPSHPSCSAYAGQAVERYGLIMGSILTADRLIHEQSRIETGRVVAVGSKLLVYDPVPSRFLWK